MTAALRRGLEGHGLRGYPAAHGNLSTPALYAHALRRGEGSLAEGGALVVRTGVHTGRSPDDKFIVDDASTHEHVWWGKVNAAMDEATFERLHGKVLAHLQANELFVQDLFAGADPEFRLSVRVISDSAWHALFARNMFIRPTAGDLAAFTPDFTVLHAPSLHADPATDGTKSPTFVVVNFARRLVLIGGTSYAGEIKKSIFSVLNFLLPPRGVLPMHCSANIGSGGDTAIFFGLSGTGKTT
ncbi:MAG TPA: phosphoenolpyruvate carboxykinase (ATP), partial [Kiloniellales bacterium]